jgi:hypothetical protein
MSNGAKYSYRLFVLITFVVITYIAFYWYEIRPSNIKHQCSWVRHYQEGVPAELPMTESQLRERGMLDDCDRNVIDTGSISTKLFGPSCVSSNMSIIDEYRDGKPAVEAKEWWEPADEDEYKFCLHDKGL